MATGKSDLLCVTSEDCRVRVTSSPPELPSTPSWMLAMLHCLLVPEPGAYVHASSPRDRMPSEKVETERVMKRAGKWDASGESVEMSGVCLFQEILEHACPPAVNGDWRRGKVVMQREEKPRSLSR